MVQFKILTGKQAGAEWAARHFPVQIGRAASADLRLEEDGIWDRHLVLRFDRQRGVTLTALGHALARVNGDPAEEAALRNGDVIELGPVKLQFWLGETRQGSLGWREVLTWTGIGVVTLCQFALVYWLFHIS